MRRTRSVLGGRGRRPRPHRRHRPSRREAAVEQLEAARPAAPPQGGRRQGGLGRPLGPIRRIRLTAARRRPGRAVVGHDRRRAALARPPRRALTKQGRAPSSASLAGYWGTAGDSRARGRCGCSGLRTGRRARHLRTRAAFARSEPIPHVFAHSPVRLPDGEGAQ